MKIKVKAPTRVDLAGGTLDLWPIYAFLGGAKTINMAIDIFSEVEVTLRNDNIYCIENANLNKTKEYNRLEDLLSDTDEDFLLLRKHIEYWKPKHAFSLKTFSQSPIGGGLGGSSSLSIAISKAFAEWEQVSFASDVAFVDLVKNIEAQVLKAVPGTQDYVPPLLGGLLCLHYGMEGVRYESLPVPSELLSDFLLVYTGKPHHSGLNNFEILSSCVSQDANVDAALKELFRISESFYLMLKNNETSNWSELLEAEYKCRERISSSFVSPEIAELKKITSGLADMKICGAGGGGCVVMFPKPGAKEKLILEIEKTPYKILNASFCTTGIQVEKK